MRQHILKNVEKWTRCGIDGWRLDVADAVDCVFWRDFRRLVRSINPEAVIIGECWWNSADWLRGDMWDGVMNYPVERPSELYFAKSAISAEEFTNRVKPGTHALHPYGERMHASICWIPTTHPGSSTCAAGTSAG